MEALSDGELRLMVVVITSQFSHMSEFFLTLSKKLRSHSQ